MAIVGRTSTVAEQASATSITGTLPSDRQAGDLVVVMFAMTTSLAAFTGPGAGWTQMFAPAEVTGGSTEVLAVYYQVDPASAPTASTSGAAGRQTAIVQAYGGVEQGNPIDAAAQVTTSGATTSISVTGVTTSTADALLLSGCLTDTSSRAFVIPSGMTGVAQYSATGVGRAGALAEEARPTPGATGSRVWTMTPSASLAMAGFTVALRPVGPERAVRVFVDAAARRAVEARRWVGEVLFVRPVRPAPTTAAVSAGLSVSAAATRGAHGAVSASPGGLAVSGAATVHRVAASTPITVTLEVELTAGVWTDITDSVSYRSGPVTIRQGRPTEYDDVAAGVFSCALWNGDGRFMPGNTASPLYPNWGKDKRIRWSVTKAGVTYKRFEGWVQAIMPEYPSDTLPDSIVAITAVDALGLLEQRRLRSNFTEVCLMRARRDGVQVDVYEATGATSGYVATLTNYSTDAAAGFSSFAYSTSWPVLSFGSDNDIEVGGVVSCQDGISSTTSGQFQPNPLQVMVHVKCPTQEPPSTGLIVTSFYDNSNNALCHLSLRGGAGNGTEMHLMNAANTVSLAWIASNLPLTQWVRVRAQSRSDNPALSDWFVAKPDSVTTGQTSVSFDVRTLRWAAFPGTSSASHPAVSWGGVAALGTRTPINWHESFPAAPVSAINRMSMVDSVAGQLPVTVGTTGTWSGNVLTGRWSGRNLREVLAEIARSYNGLVFVNLTTGYILCFAKSVLYPRAALATIDLDADCVGAPSLIDGTEAKPTRIDAEWPGGVSTAIDTAAEAGGLIRSKRVTTVAPTDAQAKAVAADILARGVGGIRVSRVTVDLMGSKTDHAEALLNSTGSATGLFPTQRLRLVVPTSHFAQVTKDVHVQGWTETYGLDQARIQLDTTPAISETLASETWTGSNGAAWPAQWLVTSTSTGATVDIQGNRGRIVGGTTNGGQVSRYVSATFAADTDTRCLIQVQGTAVAALLARWNSGNYRIQVTAGEQPRLTTNLGLLTSFGPMVSAGTDYRVRLRVQSGWVQAKAWDASGAEPGAWDVTVEDGSVAGTGWVGLSLLSGVGQTVLFDDFTCMTGA